MANKVANRSKPKHRTYDNKELADSQQTYDDIIRAQLSSGDIRHRADDAERFVEDGNPRHDGATKRAIRQTHEDVNRERDMSDDTDDEDNERRNDDGLPATDGEIAAVRERLQTQTTPERGVGSADRRMPARMQELDNEYADMSEEDREFGDYASTPGQDNRNARKSLSKTQGSNASYENIMREILRGKGREQRKQGR